MSNISKRKRESLLSKLEELKKNLDDDMVAVINEVESELNRKKYGLVWEEHEERVDIEMQNKIPVFAEVKDREIKTVDENKFNFLLEGDNLHSLKLLEKTHKGKIDVIYIDPPYNTGNMDFMYNDKILDKEDSFKHSKWLSYILHRIQISKQLLSKSGLIFVSIDDNELYNLKLLLDEVFGEKNFIATLPTVMNLKGNQDQFGFAGVHEYTVVYSKNKPDCAISNFSLDEETILKDWEVDSIGYYKKGANLKSTGVNAPRNKRPNLYFPIYIKKNDEGFYVSVDDNVESVATLLPETNGEEMSWRWSKEKIRNERENIIVVNGLNNSFSIYKKQRPELGNLPSQKPKSLWYKPEYSSGNGTSLLKNMFGKKLFNNPKPLQLLKDILFISTSKNSTVLDFFAGSGTTAHAVLELNKEDNGNRKFILATNNENNICEDITYQRIKNVIQGYSNHEPIESNLKYYKTEFVDKLSDGTVSTQLMNHIKELIQLEHHIDIDNEQIKVIFNELELDEVLGHECVENCKKLFIPSDILTTAKQDELIEKLGIEIIEIPTYYFAEELREVNEL